MSPREQTGIAADFKPDLESEGDVGETALGRPAAVDHRDGDGAKIVPGAVRQFERVGPRMRLNDERPARSLSSRRLGRRLRRAAAVLWHGEADRRFTGNALPLDGSVGRIELSLLV